MKPALLIAFGLVFTAYLRSIQGVAHGPSEEKMRCISMHRCSVRGVNGR
jgi:hypothetical protein